MKPCLPSTADISIMAYPAAKITSSFRLSGESGPVPSRHNDDFHNTANKEKIVIVPNNFGNTPPLAGNRSSPVVCRSINDGVSRVRGPGHFFMSNIELFGQATVSKSPRWQHSKSCIWTQVTLIVFECLNGTLRQFYPPPEDLLRFLLCLGS